MPVVAETLAYELWDVFSATPFAGNQLAVFLNANGLDPEEMQDLAREMNFSESSFILPRDEEVEAEQGTRIRIFTPQEELDFAGHPTLGTAASLFLKQSSTNPSEGGGAFESGIVTLDLPIGAIPVAFHEDALGLFGEMLQPDPAFLEEHDPIDLAPLIGLHASRIRGDLPIRAVSTGRPNIPILLDSLSAVQEAQIDWAGLDRYLSDGTGPRGIYLLSFETRSPDAALHARKIMRDREDAATGSAAGCAAAWLVAGALVPSDTWFTIEQGIEIDRPSRLRVRARRTGDEAADVRVGGYSVRVGSGTMMRPRSAFEAEESRSGTLPS